MFPMRYGFLQQNFMITIGILSMFCKDSNLQFGPRLPKVPKPPGFTIYAPRRVTVQHNLCVHIPCTFQIPPIYTLSRDAQGIWIKGDPDLWMKNIVARKNGQNDPQDEYPRFFLTGEVWKGDCSLRILDAKYEDNSHYTFRLEEGGLRFSFLDDTTTVTVIDLTDTPEISPVQTLVAGEMVTLTCTSPGRCAGKTPKITWEGTITGKATKKQYTINNEDGTRTYHSNLTFTPSVKDSLGELRCNVTFADNQISISETIKLEVEETGSNDNTGQACSSIDYKLIAGIIGVNIIILLLIGLGLLCFIKRHMKSALSANRPHESKPQGSESTYQDLIGQNNHIYNQIIMK